MCAHIENQLFRCQNVNQNYKQFTLCVKRQCFMHYQIGHFGTIFHSVQIVNHDTFLHTTIFTQ